MFAERNVPVFIINGFLESGKSTFIQNAIIRDPKMLKEKVLVIVCEEGEVEYDDVPPSVIIYNIDKKEQIASDVFAKLREKYRPTYVIIEYNGVWGMQQLYNTPLPKAWKFADQLTIVDGETFTSYYANMKSIFADMMRKSSTVVINRCQRTDDFKTYKTNVKMANPQADIMYVNDEEGIMDIMLEEDLPYNLNDPVIELNKDTFVIWYIDMVDNVDRYVGKTVEYVAQVAKPDYFRDDFFFPGNSVMTCCADDMQFLGFVCQYDKASTLKEGGYVRVRAEIRNEFAPEYEEEGPVLYAKSVVPIAKPRK
ncbi:MAG: GTPase [Clostridia bacterium]|nr:GTPase [Clostridia bacterium]